MDSTAELILQGHFSKLRDAINKQAMEENKEGEVIVVLKRAFNYFDVLEREGQLNSEGQALHHQLAELLDKINRSEEVEIPGKLPMQKAKPKRNSDSQKKTGT